MGDCKYCGKSAGLLHYQHSECAERHDRAANQIPEFFAKALDNDLDAARFRELADQIARSSFIGDSEFRLLCIDGMKKMALGALADHVVTEREDARLLELSRVFGITANDLGDVGFRLVKAQIIDALERGEFPTGIRLENCPVLLQRGETALWLFNRVTYYMPRTRTQYVGASHGVSVRLMKGVYYRVGAFRGEPVCRQYLSEEGSGALVLGSSNVYFWSQRKALKIPVRKILAAKPYTDGIEIMRDGANAKPAIFTLDDPPFACDVIARLAQI